MEEENIFEVILLVIFLFFVATNAPPTVYKETPDCFPDYRPGIKCQAFEKLPY